jgi:hypothetical protein
MLEQQDKERIRSLLAQIDAVYKEAQKRPSGNVCDICGQGDHQAKHALLKIKEVVHGYERRPSVSPRLCFRHGGGWAHSFNSFYVAGRSDEEIDLHFALYLAKQLKKEKAHEDK